MCGVCGTYRSCSCGGLAAALWQPSAMHNSAQVLCLCSHIQGAHRHSLCARHRYNSSHLTSARRALKWSEAEEEAAKRLVEQGKERIEGQHAPESAYGEVSAREMSAREVSAREVSARDVRLSKRPELGEGRVA